jgi:phenylacetate-CoA ligase
MLNQFTNNSADEFMTEAEIKLIQVKLLRQHLEYCRDASPYYRQLLQGKDFSDFKLEDLTQQPLTDKHDFSSKNDDFIAINETDIADIVFSSGTTGRPCKIIYSEADLERLAYNEAQAFTRFGVTCHDRVLLTCTMDRCFVAGLAYFLGIRQLGATAIRNGLNSFASHARVIDELSPTVIVGVPSFLRKLGMFMQQSGNSMASVTRLVCIGEPIRQENLTLSPVAVELETIWQAKLFSTYASSETITTFAECEVGRGAHLSYELGIVEIVDEQGQLLPSGQLGEVVVTPLQMTGTPLIRFKTGDISFIIDEPCECGRQGVRLGPILGRNSQMLKVNGTTIFPQVVFSELAVIAEVDEYYIEVKGQHLADQVEIFVALNNDKITLNEISHRINAVTRISLKVTAVSREAAMTKVFAANSRKPTRFFDLR